MRSLASELGMPHVLKISEESGPGWVPSQLFSYWLDWRPESIQRSAGLQQKFPPYHTQDAYPACR